MTEPIAWEQPEPAREADRRALVQARLRALRTVWVGLALLGVPLLVGIAWAAPGASGRAALVLVLFAAAYPVLLAVSLLGEPSGRPRYRIDDDGLAWVAGGRRDRIPWDQVVSYRLDDHPDLPGLRLVQVRDGPGPWRAAWCFDPDKVPEASIAALLREHVRAAPGPSGRAADRPLSR